MAGFETTFQEQAFPLLLEQFGETVVYRPLNGTARTITALVKRSHPESIDSAQHGIAPLFTIEALNSATTGIALSEINTGRDSIDVALKYGGTRETRSIKQLLPNRGATTKIEVN